MGIYAVQQAIETSNSECTTCDFTVPDLNLDYTFGRVDCETAPYTNATETLPSSTLNYEGIMTYFSEEFGFTPFEVTALMGAHTMGKAQFFNSGYQGSWVTDENQYFNNKYYSNILKDSGKKNFICPYGLMKVLFMSKQFSDL